MRFSLQHALLLVLTALIALPAATWAWAEPDYKYRAIINITHGSVSDITGWEINVTVDTASLIKLGYMRSDCADVRFYDDDDVTKLPYYLYSGCNTKNTLFYVKAADNGSQIFMYYGYSNATSESNGEQVFEFFDDFSSGTLNSSKWNLSGATGNWEVNTTTLPDGSTGYALHAFGAVSYINGLNSVYSNVTVEVYAYFAKSLSESHGFGVHARDTDINNFYTMAPNIDADTASIWKVVGGTWTELWRKAVTTSDLTWYKLQIRTLGSSIQGSIYDTSGNLLVSMSATDSSLTSGSVGLRTTSATPSNVDAYFYKIIARKTAEEEPYGTFAPIKEVTIELRDEDTGDLINETGTISIYNINGEFIKSYTTDNGTLVVPLPALTEYMIVGWTNATYTNQRRIIIRGEPPDTITIYLLKDGRGSINYFNTYSSSGVKVPRAEVLITWGGRVIDHGFSDSEGRFISYLDPYKIYLVNATKEGYESNVSQFYGTGAASHTIILILKPSALEELVKIRFLPEKERIPEGETAYLWIVIDNWAQVDNISVLVFDDMAFLPLYRDYGITEAGRSEVFFFDLNDTDTSWCNATILCTGNSTTVRWRVMPTALNDFGKTGRVYAAAFYYLADGTTGSHEAKMWITKALTGIKKFIMKLSQEQRMFIGLFLVLLVTGIMTAEFQLGFRQAGWIAMTVMVVNVVIGFWDKWLIIAPLVVFISLIAWRETQ